MIPIKRKFVNARCRQTKIKAEKDWSGGVTMFENILHINSFVVVFPRGSHWCALPPRRGILHLKLFGLESYLIKFETLKRLGSLIRY